MPLHLFQLHLASLCVFFFSFGHVLSCSAWPVLRGGLAALCLVSQLSVWSRGALLRRLSQCLCEYELVCILSRVCISFPMLLCLSARSILDEHFVSPSLTLLLVGEDGTVASAEVAESPASFASSDRPSVASPSCALPEDSSHGSHERKNHVKIFRYY